MDNTSKLANQYVERQYKQTKDSLVRASKKVVNKKNLKQAKQKIHVVTEEAVEALVNAIDILSKQVPQPVSNRANQTLAALKSRTGVKMTSRDHH
jgi:seryl-tRNA synthetase